MLFNDLSITRLEIKRLNEQYKKISGSYLIDFQQYVHLVS
jgi:hypothetical protein